MTLNAIQTYAASITNGVQSPNWSKPLLSQVSVPSPGVVLKDQPQIFIWGAVANEHRTSIPRATPGINPTLVAPGSSVYSGWKERAYTLSLWLYGVEASAESSRDTKFPVLIEQVCNALKMAAIPLYLTDAVTGEQSELLSIGEEISWEYDVDRTLTDQQFIHNECLIQASVLEQSQW